MHNRVVILSKHAQSIDSDPHDSISIIDDVQSHTMETALYPYLQMKIHPLISSFNAETIVVRGKYERTHSILSNEKLDKQFNWKRPTVELSDDNKTLYLNCFPGKDYIYQYANVVASYIRINMIEDVEVLAEIPKKETCINALLKTNLSSMPTSEIIILGKVEKLNELFSHQPWEGNGDFCWSGGIIGGKVVSLLGCKFSFWGDIAGNIIQLLAKNDGVETIIYTGKVGGLQIDMQTNAILATGYESYFQGKVITWENVLFISPAPNVIHGKHYTLPSVLQETKSWFEKIGFQYSFVDCEIGQMATSAKRYSLKFSYLHLISDNVAKVQNEHLGNERESNIIRKRNIVNVKLLEIFYFNILNLCGQSYINLRFFKSLPRQLEAENKMKDETKINPYHAYAIVLYRG